MRLATVTTQHGERLVAALDDTTLLDLAAADSATSGIDAEMFGSMLAFIAAGEQAMQRATDLIEKADAERDAQGRRRHLPRAHSGAGTDARLHGVRGASEERVRAGRKDDGA